MLIDVHTHLVNPDFSSQDCKKNFAIRLMLKKCNYTSFENYLENLENLAKNI